ncbi:drug/metabolite transporter [Lactarius sanguifluus]|nr:drug/metabolite transporter [Lactarius sanguifluus]
MSMSVKWLNSSDKAVPTLELIQVRMAITYVCSVAYMYWRRIPDPLLGPKNVRTLLVLRGFAGFLTLSGAYFSLQHLSLSDATVLTFIAPILTGFSGAIFLKEPLSIGETVAGLCSFIGIVLISRPQFLFGSSQAFLDPSEGLSPTERMLSISAALIGVLGATGTYTVLRAIGKRAHVLHSLTFFSSQSVLVSTLGMILFKIPLVTPTRISWLAMLLIAVLGLIAQILLGMGLQRETAGRGTLAVYTSIIFAVMFEFTVFHTTPSPLSITGALIIMSSSIYTTLSKRKTATNTASGTTLERSAGGASAPDCDDDLEA